LRRIALALLAATVVLVRPAVAQEWREAYRRGVEALRQRQPERAVTLLQRAIAAQPEPGNDYYPYLALAEACIESGDFEDARRALMRSNAIGKEPPAARGRLAARLRVEAGRGGRRGRGGRFGEPPPAAEAAPQPSAAPPPTTVAPARRARAVASTGTLDLRTDPDGATVLLAGRLLGVSPLRIDVAPGDYQVTLRREGSADQVFPVHIETRRVTIVSRGLTAAAEPTAPPVPPAAPVAATVVVYSEPTGASVYLDDEPLGATAPGTGRLVKSGVAPGRHRLRLTLSGYPDLSKDVEVTPAGPNNFTGTLIAAPPPWRGTAIGLLVFGLVCAAAAIGWKRFRQPIPAAMATRAAVTAVAPTTLASPPSPELRETVPLAGTTQLSAPETFGEYRLLEQLGRGGMAAVFKAERRGELYALKRPLPVYLDEAEFLERFLREAELGRALHHPNIIRIHERGEVSGVPYFTMELVEGETLHARVRRVGALDPRDAARIIAQVAEALDYAHLKGVVHRDLKPSNIMILKDGTVKVMDYGIARAQRFEGLTVTGAFLGTPDYVAPETAEGKGTDARSDLYALGVVFYEILTGKKPFVGDTPFATLRKHCTEPPTPPSTITPGTPRELEAIILRLLRKDPAERYPAAEPLLVELRDYLNRAA
jgi:hypothetical protein